MSIRKNPPGIIAAILIIAVVATGIFFINPLRDQIIELKEAKGEKSVQLAELEEEYKKLKKIAENLPTEKVAQRKLLYAIPETLNQDLLIKSIKKIAEKNEIFFSSISFSIAKDSNLGEGISAVRISATFKGSYDDLINFLEAIEESRREIVVKSINVQIEEPEKTEEVLEETEAIEVLEETEKTKEEELYASFSLNMEAYFQGKLE